MSPVSLHALSSTSRPTKRVGRGNGSRGKTAGRGTKGQKSRAGHHMLPAQFEGGQNPMTQRLPLLRGFRNPRTGEWAAVTTANLEKAGLTKVDLAEAKKAKLVPREARYLAVIGSAKLSHKLSVTADRISAGATKAITAAGGTATAKQARSEDARGGKSDGDRSARGRASPGGASIKDKPIQQEARGQSSSSANG